MPTTNFLECESCMGHGKLGDADTGLMRQCLDCRGTGQKGVPVDENAKAASRLVPGTMKIATQAVDDAIALELGRELMQPMPPGWYRSHNELEGGRGWSVLAIDAKPYFSKPWPERQKYCSQAEAIELAEAHRLCREQAWAKHRKNTGADHA